MSSPKPGIVPILPTPPPEMSSLRPNGPLSSEVYYRILHGYGNQLMELGETQYALQLPSDPRARATLQRRAHYFDNGRPSRAKKRKKEEASRVSDHQRPPKRSFQSSLPTTTSQNDEPMPEEVLRSTEKASCYSVVSNEENEELSGQFDDAEEEDENTNCEDVEIFLHFVNHAQECN